MISFPGYCAMFFFHILFYFILSYKCPPARISFRHQRQMMMASCYHPVVPTNATSDNDGVSAAISAVHPDVLLSHILTRLDGPTLAAASCASSLLHALISSDDKLWRDVCSVTWPSTAHPRLREVISAFPSAHRSFFSASFPLLRPRHNNSKADLGPPSLLTPSQLISAVDIRYQGKPVFAKVVETKTASSGWFGSAPFRIDLLGRDGSSVVAIPAKFSSADGARGKLLEDNLAVSWIVVDPTRRRAANVSSRRPVSVVRRRRWMMSSYAPAPDDVELRYSTVVGGGAAEMVEVAVVVTCGIKAGGEAHVREVSLMLEDMEGRNVSGEESLVILGAAMEEESGRIRRSSMGEERGGNYYYEEYVKMRRERRERKEMREKMVDIACMSVGLSIFFALWCFVLYR